MKTIGAFEAKTHFSQLLREVEAGEAFEIQRRNRPVARLVGVRGPGQAQAVHDMVAPVRVLRQLVAASGDEIREWIAEGRRQ